jgi:stage II sporulation protein E
LKKKGVVVREFVFLDEDSFGEGRISIEARAAGKNTMSATALGGFLSDFFDRRLVPSSESAMTLGRVYDTFIYEDEPRYNMLSAVSRAVREDEKVSGDNFSLEEYNQSQVIMMIADGMGSGEQACRDSQSVIEFMERFMEAGFQKEKAFTMVNGALASQTGGCNLTTLDVCAVNLLTGEAEFMKAGAAASYIKHGKRVDEISQDTLPLGSRQELSPITQGIKLSDTDMIIMVSDGISESIENEGRTSLKEVLSKSRASNPRELSDFILQYAINCQGGRIRDDMTVLACMLAEMGD